MNWEAIGAVAEVGGAAAVVATWVYFAKQVRQNTSALVTVTYDSVTSGFNDVNGVMASEGLRSEEGRILQSGPRVFGRNQWWCGLRSEVR